MRKPLFALVDCNNFFVSCEQVFRPDLLGKPVVVLSSNDGCVVARSQEARALGIPMAAPAFKHKQLFNDNGVVQFSANFELYGDISRRITEILTSITPRLEVYSIDESFLDISQLNIRDYTEWGEILRQKILEWVGVKVSIGIAPTKTLAKLASERAKKDDSLRGVLNLANIPAEPYLSKTPVEDIWGVGWRMGPKLRLYGITSALDIAHLSPEQGRGLFKSVNGERLVRELQGQCCIPLERIKVGQHSISSTRTFGQEVNESHVVEAALASFVARAAQRLRSQKLRARKLSIFLATNRHRPYYQRWNKELTLQQPTADTGTLISCANELFRSLYQPNARYYRAGIWLYDLEPDSQLQTDLLGRRNITAFNRSKSRMRAVDGLNESYGRRLVHYASEDLAHAWQPRKSIKSPAYTTSWQELPRLKIV